MVGTAVAVGGAAWHAASKRAITGATIRIVFIVVLR